MNMAGQEQQPEPLAAAFVCEITPDSDLMIRLECAEHDDEQLNIRNNNNDEHADLPKPTEFKVKRAVLVKSSKVFARLLSGGFKEENDKKVTLHDDRVRAMLIWFRFLHDVDLEETYQVSHHEVWYLVEVADKYDLDIKLLRPWFAKWYKQTPVNDIDSEEMIYPCWVFDHAVGFQRVTKYLVYNATRVVWEQNPTTVSRLRVRPLITRKYLAPDFAFNNSANPCVEQLNGAKGRLTTILEQCLDETIKDLAEANCTCSNKNLEGFLRELIRLEIFPFRAIFRRNHSVNEIVAKFESFNFEALLNSCSDCHAPKESRQGRKRSRFDLYEPRAKSYKELVKNAQKKVAGYFDGLCLDCMNPDKPKSGGDYYVESDEDSYDDRYTYDRYCRIAHGEPTQYFSLYAQREKHTKQPTGV